MQLQEYACMHDASLVHAQALTNAGRKGARACMVPTVHARMRQLQTACFTENYSK